MCFVDGDGGVCGTMIEKVERLVMEAAIEQWSYSTPKEASYVNSKDRVVEPSVCVTVVDSSLTKSGKVRGRRAEMHGSKGAAGFDLESVERVGRARS